MKPTLIASLTIGLALGSAQAATITITNPSFETTAVATGAFNTFVSDWQDIGAAGDNGVFRGNGDFGQGAGPTDGLNMAFINDVTTAGLVQTVGTTYQTGLSYELKVDIASRNTPIDIDDGATLVLYTGSITGLTGLTLSNIVATFFVNSVSGLTSDVFNTFTLTATAAQVDAIGGVGQQIGLGIVGGIIGGATTNRTQNYDIDNVRLVSIPEPVSLSLVLGMGGILLLRRRRSA